MVAQILREEYSDGPGGLSGNDDAGQMSAWYIFGAIGFYPLDPVSGNYQLTPPQFGEVSIQLPGNRRFEIVCHKDVETSSYISRVVWNGKLYGLNYITHNMLQQGGTLEVFLGDKPTAWGSRPANRAKGF